METVTLEVGGGVAWVTLDRPEVMNAFDARMQDELSGLWRSLRADDDVRVVVLTGAGDRAFCTGIDRAGIAGDGTAEGGVGFAGSPFHLDDPGAKLGPKSNDFWKPVIGAVNGIACGGAFYLLGECDILIASDNATFFDPHVTYGMPASYESMLMVGRMPLGEVLRMQLTGAAERVSAQRAYDVGLVSEVVPAAELRAAAQRLADTIAASPTLAVQATLKAVWTAAELGRRQALDLGYAFVAMGMTDESLAEGQRRFTSGERVEWRLR
ncbi:MAG TPA: enoyl-CoA hydratase-related protein [Mycobacteriales bacterium]|jgi:enoyl-CoA hydratase/carnithine racemase|nr:enoyl-CoA hydratase-related protein [Mycobacteriales bacterium]